MNGTKNLLAVLVTAASATAASAAPFTINPLATFKHSENFDESAAEIVAFDPRSQRFFVVNADADTVDVLTLDEESLSLEADGNCTIDLAANNGLDGFTLGGPNSVAVYDGRLAVALEDDDKQADGRIAVYDAETCSLWDSYPAGALPDMVTFTPDGDTLVAANEGEPSDDYTVDPEGSVTIIDLVTDAVTHVGFSDFNGDKDALIAAGVRIFGNFGNASVAEDLEPEYIAVSADSSTAFVTLQENNAVATIDLEVGEVLAISPLGTKDFSRRGNGLDYTNKDDQANIVNAPLVGMYQPDAIATFQRGNNTFVVTANEGDARDYEGFSEEVRVEDLDLDPALVAAYPGFADGDDLGRPKTTTVDGDIDNDGKVEIVHLYGARSISIWRARRDGTLSLVADTGSALEEAVADQFPSLFNASNDEDGLDDRSDDKGPEPEAISIAEIENKLYAFVGLERSSQIAIFDLSNFNRPKLVQLVNNRVNGALGPDLGPESVIYISADDSPIGTALMAVSNEVSGTTTVYTVK
jgi:DNA-binding beta-propeller fold protein YncE